MFASRAKILQPLLASLIFVLASLVVTNDARAQYSAGITGSRPNLGNVASAASGPTVFQVTASTGAISKISGNGDRVSTGTSIVEVTVACGSPGFCNNDPVNVTVTPTGTPTGRAGTMGAFTVSAVSPATITNISGSGTDTLTFQLGPIGKNSSKKFRLGMQFPILGSDSGGATGAAQSSFLVTLDTSGGVITTTGTGIATVYRPLMLTKNSDLAFGRIVRPTTGSGSVAINAITGLRTLSGSVVGLATPSPSRANYTVDGEGGRQISISVPASVIMTGPSGTLTVTTTTSFTGTPTLSGILGLPGTYNFSVGGSFPVDSTTPSGSYSGVFNVTVSYN